MVIGGMDAGRVAAYFGGKNILVTGSTGFLGKVLVEKILRVQPGVRKLFLLVRATNDESARHRIQTEKNGGEGGSTFTQFHGGEDSTGPCSRYIIRWKSSSVGTGSTRKGGDCFYSV
ncbi:putative fatty acyl-CoA reductase 5 [Triticum urartu]|uniref:Fatty acyl-CoA reductase n=1 Tax=Triticum urartu TaxID=4572 RepID=M7YKA0_TRIUA|nr:putative fatty acyl-CoA reductase 5 [Triticum urartu]